MATTFNPVTIGDLDPGPFGRRTTYFRASQRGKLHRKASCGRLSRSGSDPTSAVPIAVLPDRLCSSCGQMWSTQQDPEHVAYIAGFRALAKARTAFTTVPVSAESKLIELGRWFIWRDTVASVPELAVYLGDLDVAAGVLRAGAVEEIGGQRLVDFTAPLLVGPPVDLLGEDAQELLYRRDNSPLGWRGEANEFLAAIVDGWIAGARSGDDPQSVGRRAGMAWTEGKLVNFTQIPSTARLDRDQFDSPTQWALAEWQHRLNEEIDRFLPLLEAAVEELTERLVNQAPRMFVVSGIQRLRVDDRLWALLGWGGCAYDSQIKRAAGVAPASLIEWATQPQQGHGKAQQMTTRNLADAPPRWLIGPEFSPDVPGVEVGSFLLSLTGAASTPAELFETMETCVATMT